MENGDPCYFAVAIRVEADEASLFAIDVERLTLGKGCHGAVSIQGKRCHEKLDVALLLSSLSELVQLRGSVYVESGDRNVMMDSDRRNA
jgi:hypothetical protein